MKICFITPEFVTEAKNFDGGLSNYLYRISLGLLELGHQPVVIVASETTEVIIHRGIEVHRINVESQLQPGVISRLYQSRVLNQYLSQYVRQNPIDLVQYTSFLGGGYYRLPGIPSVVRISSYEPLLMTYYGYDVASFQDEIALEDAAIRRADGVFGPSQLLAREIEKNFGCPVQVIESPFTYDAPELDYAYFDTFHLEKYLLFFGTLGLLKGVKTIAEALPAIFSQYPDLKFVFIGRDAGFNGMNMMDYVHAQAGIYRERVIHIDKLEHKRLYPFVEKALAVVLPSRIDNFPNTCIEAMAHGKIVIGTRNTGIEQLIQEGVSGFFCERDNPNSLLHTVEQVINLSIEQRTIIEHNARKRIERLLPKYIVNEHIDFYKKVISAWKPGMKHEKDDFATRVLWEGLKDTVSKNNALFNQNQELRQRQHLQDETSSAIHSSRTFRMWQMFSRAFTRLFPAGSTRKNFLLLLYKYMRRIFTVTIGSPVLFSQNLFQGEVKQMHALKKIKTELERYGLLTDKEECYLDNYMEFLASRRNENIKFLEIGIFKGASLVMWANFFRRSEIHGIDINQEISQEFYKYINDYKLSKRIIPHLGVETPAHTMPLEQRRAFFDKLFSGTKFDIILDDGAHTYTHTKGSFEVLFTDYLNPGGIYIIEDWGTTYFPHWVDGSEGGETGMAKIIKELYDEVALIDRLKGQGVADLTLYKSSIKSVTIRFGQIWIFKNNS